MSSRFNESTPRLARVIASDALSDKVRDLVTSVYHSDDWGIMRTSDVARRFGRDALRAAYEHGYVEADIDDDDYVVVASGGMQWARSGKPLPGIDDTMRVKTYPPRKDRICRHCGRPTKAHVTACDGQNPSWMAIPSSTNW